MFLTHPLSGAAMMIREPAVAGRFYPRERSACNSSIEECLRAAAAPPQDATSGERILGGIVPHAGWICSGAVAAGVLREIAHRMKQTPIDAYIIFGAIHVLHVGRAAVFPSGAWETPLGLADVEARIVDRLCGQCGLLESDPHAHEEEHSIEVEVPFLQHLSPGVPIVPIMVPVTEQAADLGAAIGRTCANFGIRACFLCSTDLTHYGPAYGFTPHGSGREGLTWAKNVNDRRMIDLMLNLREREAVKEAVTNRNACGGGAIAATLAACKVAGARRATLLQHTSSEEVLTSLGYPASEDAVGYAGILIE